MPTLQDLIDAVEDMRTLTPEEGATPPQTEEQIEEGRREALELVRKMRDEVERQRAERGEPAPEEAAPAPPPPEPTREETLARLRALYGPLGDEAVTYVENERLSDGDLRDAVSLVAWRAEEAEELAPVIPIPVSGWRTAPIGVTLDDLDPVLDLIRPPTPGDPNRSLSKAEQVAERKRRAITAILEAKERLAPEEPGRVANRAEYLEGIRRILWLNGAEAIARVEAAGLDERRLAVTYRTLVDREKELAAADPSAITVLKICREVLDQVPADSPLTLYREPVIRGPHEPPAAIWQRLEKAGVDIETNVYRLAASHSSHADIANAAGTVHPALLEAVEGFMDAFDDGLTREDLLQIIRSQADAALPARRMLARHRNWQQRPLAQLKLLADSLAGLVNDLDDDAAARERRKQDGPAGRE